MFKVAILQKYAIHAKIDKNIESKYVDDRVAYTNGKQEMIDFFYVYKKEVQKMNDLIEMKLIKREDAECLHKLQIEAFMPLYKKYQDDATSPAKESLEIIEKKIVEDKSDFYFILFNGEKVGAVRVKWYKGGKVYENVDLLKLEMKQL